MLTRVTRLSLSITLGQLLRSSKPRPPRSPEVTRSQVHQVSNPHFQIGKISTSAEHHLTRSVKSRHHLNITEASFHIGFRSVKSRHHFNIHCQIGKISTSAEHHSVRSVKSQHQLNILSYFEQIGKISTSVQHHLVTSENLSIS